MRVLVGLMVLMVLSLPTSAFALSLGPDCSVGTVIQPGSNDSAGKITMGPYSPSGYCTVNFSTSRNRACSALNETAGGGWPRIGGGKTTLATMKLSDGFTWQVGDVFSYQCQLY